MYDHSYSPCLQTAAGDPSSGITWAEFREVMGKVKKKCEQLAQANPRNWVGGVKFIMDNARYHGLTKPDRDWEVVRIPPYSPEFNKPVEHMFNTIKGEFQRRYSQILAGAGPGRFVTVDGARTLLGNVIGDVATAETVSKDVDTYMDMLNEVIAAEGGYITEYN